MSLIFAKSFAESNSGGHGGGGGRRVGSRRGALTSSSGAMVSTRVRANSSRLMDEESEAERTQRWASCEQQRRRPLSLMEQLFAWATGSNNRRQHQRHPTRHKGSRESPRQVSFGLHVEEKEELSSNVRQKKKRDNQWDQSYLTFPDHDNGLKPRLVVGATHHQLLMSKTTTSSLDSGATTTTNSTSAPEDSMRRVRGDARPRDLHDVRKDCFIIPEEFIHRFLPDGLSVPRSPGNPHIHVLEVADPRLPIGLQLFDIRSLVKCLDTNNENQDVAIRVDMEALDEVRANAMCAFGTVHNNCRAKEGYQLRNLEPDGDYPYINYYVLHAPSSSSSESVMTTTPSNVYSSSSWRRWRRSSSSPSSSLRFSEVATIARPPVQMETKQPLTKATGFVVCIYKVFKGDNGQKFERNWLFWTGKHQHVKYSRARMLYRNLPKHVGLRRMTLHRSEESEESELITYVLLVECTRFMYHLGQVANLLNVLRGRICGYTGLFRVVDSFL